MEVLVGSLEPDGSGQQSPNQGRFLDANAAARWSRITGNMGAVASLPTRTGDSVWRELEPAYKAITNRRLPYASGSLTDHLIQGISTDGPTPPEPNSPDDDTLHRVIDRLRNL